MLVAHNHLDHKWGTVAYFQRDKLDSLLLGRLESALSGNWGEVRLLIWQFWVLYNFMISRNTLWKYANDPISGGQIRVVFRNKNDIISQWEWRHKPAFDIKSDIIYFLVCLGSYIWLVAFNRVTSEVSSIISSHFHDFTDFCGFCEQWKSLNHMDDQLKARLRGNGGIRE